MKCPKCGFNSFEYYDSCKKCSGDLSGYKQTYSIAPLVLPFEAKEKLVEEFQSAESATVQVNDTVETHDDIFSFDLPEDSAPATAQSNDNPFDFSEPPPTAAPAGNPEPENDVFADLLESTSQAEESPFAKAETAPPQIIPDTAKGDGSSSSGGEFDLESFSWDDTVAEATAPVNKDPIDDFDSLFGDTKETPKK